MNRPLDLTGQKFERLVAVTPEGKYHCWCECICGEWVIVGINSLRSGGTRSCGCLNREKTRDANIKHGMFGTPTYKSWDAMLQRCENSNYSGFHYWGGRGISICERWHKFENFYEDMGEKPKGKTLDRWPDNDGNYEPGNCRWATPLEQQNNTRNLKPFIAYSPEGQVETSKNQRAFARKWGLNFIGISHCLTNRQKTHKNWQFKYLRRD